MKILGLGTVRERERKGEREREREGDRERDREGDRRERGDVRYKVVDCFITQS